MSQLFTPIELDGHVVRNRLWVAAMCMYSAEDGMPADWHHVHLAQFAAGGAGMVIAEATAVVPEGRISPEDTGIWNDAQAAAWAPITAAIRARGATPALQLAHGGRKSSTWSPFAGPARGSVPVADGGWPTLAPSALAYDGYATPAELTETQIDDLVDAFGAGAARAWSAGFEALELHAAHGYLVHEFLSPLSNHRTDAYGGSLENRARLLLRIVEAVRAAAPEALLMVRFSAQDGAEGGWDLAQTATVAAWAAERGAAFFDVSSGGLVAHQKITTGPGYQVHLAAGLRSATGLPVGAVGEITSGPQAEAILAAGEADVVLAGREWLRDPHFALRAAGELGDTDLAPWPAQYLRARRRG